MGILVKRQILIWMSYKISIKQQLLRKQIANRIKQMLSLTTTFLQTNIFQIHSSANGEIDNTD